jgi:hypothetical protein
MILYHGTTLDVARKIKAEGLIPHRESAFEIERSDDHTNLREALGEDEPKVYLASKDAAMMFARFRVQYERAGYGEALAWGQIRLIKKSALVNPEAKPAIVEINLPESWNLEEDIQAPMFGAKECLCSIPPEYISKIIPVKEVKKINTFTVRRKAGFDVPNTY